MMTAHFHRSEGLKEEVKENDHSEGDRGNMNYKHLFGPVPSRRLGISLGVDLVPHKVCSLDCIYCEVGKTTNCTIERKEYVPINEVLNELDDYLKQKPNLDFITFSGAGEPTLNSGIGKVISFLKEKYPQYKLALLTNSTLLHDKNLRKEIINIDLILPSLDAASEDVFKRLNHPNAKVEIKIVIKGLLIFKKEFKGEMWLELFIVPGLNDTEKELSLLKNTIQKINPQKVQLNTLDRPGTEPEIKAVLKEKLEEIAEFLKPLSVEIIAKFISRKKVKSLNKNIENQILETIRRRPCTDKDLSQMLGLHLNELNKYLTEMLKRDIIKSEFQERGVFFRTKKGDQ